jgi:hypothetical protein
MIMGANLTTDMKRVVTEQPAAVWDDDHLVFADIRSPGTVANIEKNPAVELNAVDPFVRKGYRFKGKGEVIMEGQVLSRNYAVLPKPMDRHGQEQGIQNTGIRTRKSRKSLAAHLTCVSRLHIR